MSYGNRFLFMLLDGTFTCGFHILLFKFLCKSTKKFLKICYRFVTTKVVKVVNFTFNTINS